MLSVERTGSGLPLLFLHAFPLSRRMWDVNKPALSKNFQFLSVDFPGFGDSPVVSDTSSMEDMARQTMAAIDHLKINEKMVVAGESMGGYVLFQMLRLFPERFRAAVLISTRPGPDSPEGRTKRMENIELVKKLGLKALADKQIPSLIGKTSLEGSSAVVPWVRSMIEGSNPDGVCAALRGMAERSDSTSVLSQIHIPTLVISGAEDVIIKSSEMESMANLIKTVEYHVFPMAGHLLTLEKPEQFNDIFLRFLKRRVL